MDHKLGKCSPQGKHGERFSLLEMKPNQNPPHLDQPMGVHHNNYSINIDGSWCIRSLRVFLQPEGMNFVLRVIHPLEADA
jgi:hypothetical protein